MEQRRTKKKPALNWAGPRIRQIRDQQGLSQEMLSARCEARGLILSRSTLAKIEIQVRCLTDMELLTIFQPFQPTPVPSKGLLSI